MRALRRFCVLAAADVAVLFACRTALQALRGSLAVVEFAFPAGFMGGWGSFAALIAGLVAAGAYSSQEGWARPAVVLRGAAFGTALALWQSFDSAGVPWTVAHWAMVTGGLGIVLALEREVLLRLVTRYWLTSRPKDRVIFVGDPHSAAGRRAASAVLARPGMRSVGWLSERGGVEDYLGHPSAVWEVLSHTGTDTLVLCDDLPPGLFDTVVEAAVVAGCRVLWLHDKGTLTSARPRALVSKELRMLELTFPASRAGQDVLKRVFDAVVAFALLAVLSPILTAISVWIKLDSRGPVLFVHERVGQAGRIFRMVKFRTMKNGADDEKRSLAHLNGSGDPRLFKIPDDPRVTRAGAFLRRWSLDELPQLINILRGEMSLVGPRPFFESDLAAYDDHHFIRLAVKPGVTGLWQVKGRSSIIDFEEVVRLDRTYIENWSLGLDFWILLATLPAVLRRTGAY